MKRKLFALKQKEKQSQKVYDSRTLPGVVLVRFRCGSYRKRDASKLNIQKLSFLQNIIKARELPTKDFLVCVRESELKSSTFAPVPPVDAIQLRQLNV